LVFLLWDVLAARGAAAPRSAVNRYGEAVADGVVVLAGVGAGLVGLVYFDRWMRRRGGAAAAGGRGRRRAPGRDRGWPRRGWCRAGGLSLLIAVGIRDHNFGGDGHREASAAAGRTSLALLLVIRFGAHNATEGLASWRTGAAGARASWGRLALLGLIAGGPPSWAPS
jgi:ZIP family zinc transporter